jgi:hypothetical protein
VKRREFETKKRASLNLLIIVIAAGALLLTCFGIGGCTVSCLNREARLRNTIKAKSTANEASLDNMWKTIKQKANITQKASSDIADMNEVFKDLVSGRSGGTLFKMVTENYPDLKQEEVAKMYQNLMRSVEGERDDFKDEQKVLADMVRERDNAQTTWPSSMAINWFGDDLAKTPHLKKGDPNTPEDYKLTYIFVTSKATKQMAETGEENELELFDEK